MSTKSAVIPRWADSGVPVRVSRTQRCAYWARLVQTFWPVTRQPLVGALGPAGERGQVAPGARLGEPLAPRLVPAEQGRDHGGGQLGRGVVDHGGGEHLGHRVQPGLDQVPGGERLAQVGAGQRRSAEAADPLRPAGAHPAGVERQSLDLGQLGHLLVERPGPLVLGGQCVRGCRRARRRADRRNSARSPAAPADAGHGAVGWGRVGSWARPESRAPLLRRKVMARVLQPPPVGRPAIGVGVVADAHVVGGLVDEAERLLSRAGVAVEVERRGPDQEQTLRGRRPPGSGSRRAGRCRRRRCRCRRG